MTESRQLPGERVLASPASDDKNFQRIGSKRQSSSGIFRFRPVEPLPLSKWGCLRSNLTVVFGQSLPRHFLGFLVSVPSFRLLGLMYVISLAEPTRRSASSSAHFR